MPKPTQTPAGIAVASARAAVAADGRNVELDGVRNPADDDAGRLEQSIGDTGEGAESEKLAIEHLGNQPGNRGCA
jgi:hypothetical protein